MLAANIALPEVSAIIGKDLVLDGSTAINAEFSGRIGHPIKPGSLYSIVVLCRRI